MPGRLDASLEGIVVGSGWLALGEVTPGRSAFGDTWLVTGDASVVRAMLDASMRRALYRMLAVSLVFSVYGWRKQGRR
jgi:hypothetical protein